MTEDVKYGYYSDVAQRDVDWLWYPYIPCGKITILQGDPGEGKSTFILRLTSILTNGGIFPDRMEQYVIGKLIIDKEEKLVYNIGETPIGDDKMFQDESHELHAIIKRLRLEKGYTQKEVANYLGVDVSTYAHYELARRTPDVKKLRLLAELYGLNDELLGATLPIVARAVYPAELLNRLESTIKDCPGHTGNYQKDKETYDNLKTALEPVLEIRNNALDLPNIDLTKYTDRFSNQTVKSVELDMRAEKLIFDCINKQKAVLGW